MRFPISLQIGLSLLLVLFQASNGAPAHVRGYTKKNLIDFRNLKKDKYNEEDPTTSVPTEVGDGGNAYDDEEEEETQQAMENTGKDKNKDDDDDDDDDDYGDDEAVVVDAKEQPADEAEATEVPEDETEPPHETEEELTAEETDPPEGEEEEVLLAEETDPPAGAEVIEEEEAIEDTTANDAEDEDATNNDSEGESTTSTAETEEVAADVEPHLVRLAPLYLKMSVRGILVEDGFVDALISYIETNMAASFEGFSSVSYSLTDFSQITELPPLDGRQNNSTTIDDERSISMITVHIHKFTAVFDDKPTDAADRDIALFMTMLLENTEMFQEYIDSQTAVDATVVSMGLEFDIPDPNAIQRSQAETDDKDDERNVWMIAGITVGCFLALLWMVFLHGIQSRPITDFTS